MKKDYDHKKVEAKWQKYWASKKLFEAKDNSNKKKFYPLIEFPYPSGDGMHVGHIRSNTAMDVIARKRRAEGLEVLYPMGWDAFGLPTENYAIKTGIHPEIVTKKNTDTFRRQLKALGFSFDWSREINTTDPAYYKWTQWIFLQLLKKGLAYKKKMTINWCPKDLIGLANEEVVNGCCERCGTPVEQKEKEQWLLGITKYAERLDKDLDKTEFLEKIKIQQRNWIGKSEGAEIEFRLDFGDKRTRFVILHGFQGSAKRNFIPWLKKELEARGHEVEALELPNSDHPHESEQVGHVIKNCKFDENTVVIAHSLGSVVALKALMKMNKKISGLVLVASAVSPSFSTDNEERPYWKDFNWDFDYGQIQKLTDGKIAVLSDKKETKRATYLKDLSTKLEAILIEVNSNEEHFCAEEEPEILRSVTPYVKVFTTRPDTLFGVTYIVLAPEHPWVQLMTPLLDNRKEVEDYVSKVKKETNMERTDASKEKTGIQLKGIVAVNPANNEEVPVWIADYVLSDYGTGAVMAVPAHDERDHTFAKKFGLPIKNVIESSSVNTESTDKVYTGEGILVNSVLFNGRESGSAKKEIAEFVGGKWVTTFKLRDWIFSRQRYWGEPIPVVHCELHGIVPVPEKDLPVKLPKVKNYKPTETGESPLASISKWVNTKCPQCLADKKKTKYLIFDFDGVLGDTWDVMNHAKVKMGEASTVEEAGQRALEHFSRKPFDARSENQTPEQRQKRQDWIRTFGNHLVQSEFGLFDVFIKQLKKIKNVKLAVVSSGSAQYILPAIKKSGLKFTHILAHEDHHSKEEKVEKVCRDWGISVKDPYYFTDTKADIYELEGIMGRERIIGCSWGYHGYDGLNELLPDKQILRHFNDIHRLFNQDCKATRETDTMPNWAGSSWYYLRYTDPNNKKEFADSKKLKYWTPVDWYNGGMEHTTLHLLYSRFWHKFLFDLGLVPTSEPYQKRTSHGLILAQGGEKMSKSKGNVINPDSIVEKVGADSLRLYEMFMGPFDQPIAWNTDNIAGVRRFIERVWKLYFSVIPAKAGIQEVNKGMDPNFRRDDNTGIKIHNSADKIIHKTIKKVSEDIEAMRFNTAISSMMIALNDLEKFSEISQKSYETFIQLLAPFAPHVCEELWWSLGHKQSIGSAPWPVYDPKLAVDSETNITVQVNGKMRASFMASIDTSKEELEKMARALPDVSKWLEGKRVVKVVVVPNRLINIVVA